MAVDSLGRSCKAKAKACPKATRNPFLIGAYAAECLPTLAVAHESISRGAADAGGETIPMAEAEPNPWLDMGDVDPSVPDDASYQPLLACPCTQCEARCGGGCTTNNLLGAQMRLLDNYATVFLPMGPDFYGYRAALYATMHLINTHLHHGVVSAEEYRELHAQVVSLITRCDIHV